jgi:hypothetical protein
MKPITLMRNPEGRESDTHSESPNFEKTGREPNRFESVFCFATSWTRMSRECIHESISVKPAWKYFTFEETNPGCGLKCRFSACSMSSTGDGACRLTSDFLLNIVFPCISKFFVQFFDHF